jgi:hypothetical protein
VNDADGLEGDVSHPGSYLPADFADGSRSDERDHEKAAEGNMLHDRLSRA